MASTIERAAVPDAVAAGAPVLKLAREDGFFEFDGEQCRAVGKALHDGYVSAEPFPHIALDNFLEIGRAHV